MSESDPDDFADESLLDASQPDEGEEEESETIPDSKIEDTIDILTVLVKATFTMQMLEDAVCMMSGLFLEKKDTPEAQHLRNIATFGANVDEFKRRSALFSDICGKLTASTRCFANSKDLREEDAVRLLEKLERIGRVVRFVSDAFVSLHRQRSLIDPNMAGVDVPHTMDAFNANDDVSREDLKPSQQLILYYLTLCFNLSLRKNDAKQLFYPLLHNGYFTHYFKLHAEIRQFISREISPIGSHMSQFKKMYDSLGNKSIIEEFLDTCNEVQLPYTSKDRTQFSLWNGVFRASENKFYVYDVNNSSGYQTTADLDSTNSSCHFIEQDFDYELYDSFDDPIDIPTPNCQKILTSQGFDKETCRWIYASFGRMIFPVGSMDGWQYFPFFKGTAGTGKSTLLELISMVYSTCDVGSLMSEGQRNFSVEHLYTKYMFLCMDADKKLTLSQTRWNQIVSGEKMSIEQKFKIPVETTWTATGAFAGNSYPPWVDQGGSMSRRLLVILFATVIKKVDTGLKERCRAELAAFLKKCVSCYHYVVDKHGHQGLWEKGVLPIFFHKTKRLLQADTNSLQAFLSADDQCTLGGTESCTFQTFRDAYNIFCSRNSIRPTKLTSIDTVGPVFDANRIEVHSKEEAEKYSFKVKCMTGVSIVV